MNLPAIAVQTVFLQGLRIDAEIGVFEHEKGHTQPLEIDLQVQIDASRFAPRRDQLDEVFDYQALRAAVREVAAAGHIHLLETFADRVLDRILALADVRGARIQVSKFTAFNDCRAVGVIVQRGMS